MLENGLSMWPSFDGRFLAVSAITFQYHGDAPPGQRIPRDRIHVHGKALDYGASYTVATKMFLTQGKDGFKEVPHKDMIVLTMIYVDRQNKWNSLLVGRPLVL
jgi:hypothetical protein